MEIKMKLKDAVLDDRIVEKLGLNPYCVNEGADGESLVSVEIEGYTLTLADDKDIN